MKTIVVKEHILKANARAAAENRAGFGRARLTVVNLIGSPGSGKTALLERLATHSEVRFGVLEGDPETSLDAARIERAGVPVVQIVTKGTCHLDASMVHRAVQELPLEGLRFLFIENVGNLVCPASFDLGETARVVVLSTPEGEDKPLKYPGVFTSARAVVLNKIDLIPHLSFDLDRAVETLATVVPRTPVFPLSCVTGAGFDGFVEWLVELADRIMGPVAGPPPTGADV
ncbi:MAG: hydrogenase nickel incorporation protein HypB [Candidatus Eisenbacteria bacterium]|jgi:hydrogenase nickel incorporation protein HypB|nr:hydrogenase nickel incorporation protein HypB [Candidatus Eisenbacteria bacterium]